MLMNGKRFIYKNIRLENNRQKLCFDYSIETDGETYELTEQILLPSPLPENDTTDRILRALHIALGISYYKTFLPSEIKHAYTMDSDEVEFWNTVFKNGLGEFLYKNNLSSDRLAKFKVQAGDIEPGEQDNINLKDNSALLGIGGGKDSVVAGELLKEMQINTAGFVLATKENMGQSKPVADIMDVDLLAVRRTIDPQIFDLNKLDGAYNGHVPISLIFGLIGCLLATINGDKYVIVANEASASIPQTTHGGNKINHQWSKSLEFENKFQKFINENISTNIIYTSIIRPLNSIAIAKIFSNYPKYFETFTSDNSVFKIKKGMREHPRWSSDSPKSLSSYILLAPWINDEELVQIFGQDFLNRPDLQEMFLALLGVQGDNILDCVGTPDELKLSLSLLNQQERFLNSKLMLLAIEKSVFLDNPDKELESAMKISNNHAIPEELSSKLLPLLKEKI